MRFDPAFVVLWVVHKYLSRTASFREDFRDPVLLAGPRIEYISVPSGRRYEIVARPVAEAEAETDA